MPDFVLFPLAMLAMVLILFTLPITLPIASLFDWLDRKRLRFAADHTRCVQCGSVLGEPAIAAADLAWTELRASVHLRHPNTRVHIVRRSYACCVACGAEYRWDPRRRTLQRLVDDPPGAAVASADGSA